MSNPPPLVPVNRNAVISVIAAILTVASFCTAVAPIPFTGYVCYPAAAVLGLVALSTGLASLAQMCARKEDGRAYAWIGISIGVLTLMAVACAAALGIALFPQVVKFVHQVVQ